MNELEIKKRFPKTWEKLRIFFTDQLKVFQTKIGEMAKDEDVEVPKIELLTDEQMLGVLMLNYRSLYEFFDLWKVYIQVGFGSHEEGVFTVDIMKQERNETEFKDRVSAESFAFEKALKIVEEKL